MTQKLAAVWFALKEYIFSSVPCLPMQAGFPIVILSDLIYPLPIFSYSQTEDVLGLKISWLSSCHNSALQRLIRLITGCTRHVVSFFMIVRKPMAICLHNLRTRKRMHNIIYKSGLNKPLLYLNRQTIHMQMYLAYLFPTHFRFRNRLLFFIKLFYSQPSRSIEPYSFQEQS